MFLRVSFNLLSSLLSFDPAAISSLSSDAAADIPGLLDLVIAMYEGFDGVTRAMGSEIRQKGPVEDFGSGVREGGKGLFYGWWDGITGLVTEPVAGGKKEVSVSYKVRVKAD